MSTDHPVNVEHEDVTWDVRLAENATNFMGSPKFIGILTAFIVVWVVLNVTAFVSHWDPYPFILLNLAFSAQATYAAPLILLAANRAAEKDRKAANFDYAHNSESLALLRALHKDAHGVDCQCPTQLPDVSG